MDKCTYNSHTEDTDFSVAGFAWDDGNWAKCGRHGVSKKDIETLFEDAPTVYADLRHSIEEQRLRAIGTTRTGGWLLVAFTLRRHGPETLIRPISARYMHQREVEHYERQTQT